MDASVDRQAVCDEYDDLRRDMTELFTLQKMVKQKEAQLESIKGGEEPSTGQSAWETASISGMELYQRVSGRETDRGGFVVCVCMCLVRQSSRRPPPWAVGVPGAWVAPGRPPSAQGQAASRTQAEAP